MIDITMCSTLTCPMEDTCLRKTAAPSEHQSYLMFGGDNLLKCEDYLPIAPKKAAQECDPCRENGLFDIADGCPIKAIEWAQPPGDMSAGQQSLRVEFIDGGGGAYFSIKTEPGGFAFDSGDDLRKLADLIDGLLPAYTSADVF